MAKLDQLKQEATELGITFSPNIGESKLAEKIESYYAKQETSEKEIEDAVEQVEAEKKTKDKVTVQKSGEKTIGQKAKEAEARARETRVVTIIDNDNRENNQTTTCTVNCGNEWFELGQIILPLNTPVEVMVGHLNVLKEVEIPMHVKDRVTKLSRVEMRKRYTISYEDIDTSK